MLKKTCKCAHTGKNIKPVPRFPKKENEKEKESLSKIDDSNIANTIENKIRKMNRYRWILTRMPDPMIQYTKNTPKNLGGFLPEISYKNR